MSTENVVCFISGLLLFELNVDDFGTSMPIKSEEESIPSIGVAVAHILNRGAPVTGDAFVELGGSLEAGHATQSQCSTDMRTHVVGWMNDALFDGSVLFKCRAIAVFVSCLVLWSSSLVAEERTEAGVLIEGTWTRRGPESILGRRTDIAVTFRKEGPEWTITYEMTRYPGVNQGDAKAIVTREGPYRVTVDQQELVVDKGPALVRYTFLLDSARLIMPAIVQTNPGEWAFRSESQWFDVRCEHDPFSVPVGKAEVPGVLAGKGYYSFEEAPRLGVWPRAQYLRFLERSDEKGQLFERFRLVFDEYGSPRYERLLGNGERPFDDYELRVFFATTIER